MKIFILCLLPLFSHAFTGKIVDNGAVKCFSKEIAKKYKKAFCETSAAVYYNGKVMFASDKKSPEKSISPVFSYPLFSLTSKKRNRTYYLEPQFVNAIKYEDFAISPDGNTIFATTAFDRIKEKKWDGYNTLLAWEPGKEKNAQVVNPSIRNNKPSSLKLRKSFAKALANKEFPAGMPYFKVEGLAVLPDNKIIFGIRENGATYKKFQYTSKIVETTYSVSEDDKITLSSDFKLIADYTNRLQSLAFKEVALSGLEYDSKTKKLYILTSYEKELKGTREHAGFLFSITLDDLTQDKMPTILKNDDGTPLAFPRKAEAITIITSNKLLIVYDDDRALDSFDSIKRQQNQGVFSIVEIN